MKLLIAILSFFLMAAATAKTDKETPAAKWMERLQDKWTKTTSFQAKFKQVIVDKRLGSRDESSGTFSVAKPNKLRWDSESDGTLQVFNQKELTTVRRNARRNTTTVDIFKDASKKVDARTLNVLAGRAKFGDFYRPELGADKGKTLEIKLIPKDGNAETLIAEIDKESYLLRALITDSGDTRVVTEFSEIKTEIPLEDKLFEYKPGPKDIVHMNP